MAELLDEEIKEQFASQKLLNELLVQDIEKLTGAVEFLNERIKLIESK